MSFVLATATMILYFSADVVDCDEKEGAKTDSRA